MLFPGPGSTVSGGTSAIGRARADIGVARKHAVIAVGRVPGADGPRFVAVTCWGGRRWAGTKQAQGHLMLPVGEPGLGWSSPSETPQARALPGKPTRQER